MNYINKERNQKTFNICYFLLCLLPLFLTAAPWHSLYHTVNSCSKLFHSYMKASPGSLKFTCARGLCLKFLSFWGYKCSIGLRSGLLAGQGERFLPTSTKYCLTFRTTWDRTLSCIQRKPFPIKRANGTTYSASISNYPSKMTVFRSCFSAYLTPEPSQMSLKNFPSIQISHHFS